MIFKRAVAKLRAQDWVAIAIELAIVIIGVFVGIQVANWNQARLDKASTERLLVRLLPELRSQLEFFDSVKSYYGTTQRYANQALAGWKGDPRVTDEQFVIAAYQASQTTGMSLSVESLSLTFGGDQLRNVDDPALRRDLELLLTSEYDFVSSRAVATPYREQVRRIIPIDIQRAIRNTCGDRQVSGTSGVTHPELPTRCGLRVDPAQASRTAAALRGRPELIGELYWHIGAVENYLNNASIFAERIRKLDHQLSSPR